MKKLFLLVKIQLLGWMGINKALHTKKAPYSAPTLGGGPLKVKKGRNPAVMAVLGLVLAVYFVGVSFMYSNMTAKSLLASGSPMAYLPGLMMTASSLLTLIMGIYSTGRVLYKYSDYDLTMSLPVPVSFVAASRLIVLYVYELLFTLLLMIPAMLVYARYEAPPAAFWLAGVVCMLLIPCAPLVISSALGTVVTWVGSRAKRFGSAVNTLLTLVFVGGMLYLSFSSGANGDEAAFNRNLSNVSGAMSAVYPLASMFINAVCDLDWGSFGAFAAISLGLMAAFSLLISLRYRELCTRVNTAGGRAKGKKAVVRVRSRLSALYRRECGRYFSSTIYLTNTAIGSLLAVIFSGVLLFSGGIPGLEGEMGRQAMTVLSPLLPLLLSLLVCMSSTTGSAISMEGHALWVVKSMPVSTDTVFAAKVLVNLTITVPATLICGVFLSLAVGAGAVLTALMFVVPLVYAAASAAFGLWVNLKLPKMDWTNDAQVVKQSAASMISMLVLPLLPVGFIVLGFLTGAPTLVTALSLAAPVILTAVLTAVLKKKGYDMLLAI